MLTPPPSEIVMPIVSGVMSQNIWGGTIFARERSDQAGGGVPPPTVGSFLIFRLENVQSGAYLHVRRKFRLDDMLYILSSQVMITVQ